MKPLKQAIEDAGINQNSIVGYSSRKAFENAIRILTMLGGETRIVDSPRTVANYIGLNPMLELPNYAPVLLKAQVYLYYFDTLLKTKIGKYSQNFII